MNTELLKAAGEAEPELLEKVAQALLVLEHIDHDLAKELTQEISAITEYTQEKVAGQPLGGPAAWGLAVGGSLAGGVLTAVASDLYDAAKRKLTSGMNFKRIMEANPELKKNYNAADLKRNFSTFHRYAPDFTADPNLAGQILRSMSEIPDNQFQTVKDLLNSGKFLRDIKRGQFQPMNTPYISTKALDDADNKAYLLDRKRIQQEEAQTQVSNDHEAAQRIEALARHMMERPIGPLSAAQTVMGMDRQHEARKMHIMKGKNQKNS